MTVSSHPAAAEAVAANTILGHPRGLLILFLTEMWERFSFYGMRGLLILYLTQHFLFSDEYSNVLFGAYIALVYVMTIIGGTLADHYLGSRKAVTFGAILLVFGHLGMAFEGEGSRQIMSYGGSDYVLKLDGRGGDANQMLLTASGAESRISFTAGGGIMQVANPAAVDLPASIDRAEFSVRVEADEFYQNVMYLSLALIIAGVGFLKANISTIVGSLYALGDARRDSGFTFFYMGINLGAFLSSMLCGYFGITYGWKYGFGLAGIGMVCGLTIFLRYQDWLEGRAEPPEPERLRAKVLGPINVESACYLAGLGIVALSMMIVMNANLVHEGYVGLLGIVILVGMVGYTFLRLAGEERDRMLAGLYFILAQIPFWALFEQAGASLNLFTDRLVDRNLLGFNVPAPMFQALNAFFIVTFAPLMAWLWVALDKRRLNPSAPVKFALAVFMAGLGFLTLVGGIKLAGAGMTSMYFIFLIYWVHTIGELMLSPVGLSAVTKLAPARAVGMTMGAWFLYSGLGNYLAGVIAAMTGAETIGGQLTDTAAAKATYVVVYTQVGYIAMGVALVMLLISPLIRKLMHGIR
ncbi:MAG: peptide MFS transporter [Pseudomonadales bacterium]|nr:peptide MFS transporter [Pseudomonadales bacterium]